MDNHIRAKNSLSYEVFSVINIFGLSLMAILCLLPIINLLAISLSSSEMAASGIVKFWPEKFTTASYQVAFSNMYFWNSMFVSIKRVLIGTGITIFLNIITAYPLSRDPNYFKARTAYVWFFFFTTLFSGGLIPTFLVVKYTGLYDSIWALIIPGSAAIWNCILMLNFFRQLPKEMEEAAVVDGAGHMVILWKIIVPVSKPVIATLTLFTIVGHWNEWFGALIYISSPQGYPLQTYLQSLLNIDVTKMTDFKARQLIEQMSPKTLRAAMVFLTALPILMVYPFLQKYFAKGLVLGSVKG